VVCGEGWRESIVINILYEMRTLKLTKLTARQNVRFYVESALLSKCKL